MRAEVVMIFVCAFFAIMLVTFLFPVLPPGEKVVGFLRISFADSTDTGIPTTILLVGFFSGLIYGAATLLIYSLARWMPLALSQNKNHQ